MNEHFRERVEQLHPKYEQLMAQRPVAFAELRSCVVPQSGVYVFSEAGCPLYVGRSKRIRHRLRYHCCGKPDQSPFAFKLARENTGNLKATYTEKGSRKELMAGPLFAAAFDAAKARLRQMELRFVEEEDALAQGLLEIYVSVALGTPYNDFETH